jgi:hypothetical protein
MKVRRLIYGLLTGIVFSIPCLTMPIWAHHGGTLYDYKKPLTLVGTIIKLELINPHSSIIVEVPNNEGSVVRWTLETHSPASLRRLGWTKDSLKPGERVTIYIFAAKNGSRVGVLSKIILPDGRTLIPVAK